MMSGVTDEPWKRLAGLVRARRDELGASQAEVGASSKTSERTVRLIEKAARSSYHASTLRSVSLALGWTPNSADRILHGEEPELAEPSIDDRISALEARLGVKPTVDGRSIEKRLEDLERLAESQHGH